MKLSMLLPVHFNERKWTLAKQIGVAHAITKASSELSGLQSPYDFTSLQIIKDRFEKAGFILYGLEGDQFDMSSIKLGLADRDMWIERYCLMLDNMGKLDIPLLCFNWMSEIGWYRTSVNILERGGALSSGFDSEDIKNKLVDEKYRISEDKLWDNLYYFLEAVLPTAESNGVKMAMHPDDPPISPFMGIGRILTSAKKIEKILNDFNSPNLGVTFCIATFETMGEDIRQIAKNWIDRKKIFFMHIRNIKGDRYKFRETFIDNGDIPVADLLKLFNDYGFDGPIRSDHAPAMYGENQEKFSGGTSVGYDMLGHIFATGYIKGICDSEGIILE